MLKVLKNFYTGTGVDTAKVDASASAGSQAIVTAPGAIMVEQDVTSSITDEGGFGFVAVETCFHPVNENLKQCNLMHYEFRTPENAQ